jgi:hypothetical protein
VDDEVCADEVCDDEDGEGTRRRRLETSRLRGVMKACATSEHLLLGEGAVIRTNSKAIEASMVGPPGVINDRERRRFPPLLPVAAAAVDVILFVR